MATTHCHDGNTFDAREWLAALVAIGNLRGETA